MINANLCNTIIHQCYLLDRGELIGLLDLLLDDLLLLDKDLDTDLDLDLLDDESLESSIRESDRRESFNLKK